MTFANLPRTKLNALIRLKHLLGFKGEKGASKYICNVKFQLLLSSMELLKCSFVKQNQKPTEKSSTILVERL